MIWWLLDNNIYIKTTTLKITTIKNAFHFDYYHSRLSRECWIFFVWLYCRTLLDSIGIASKKFLVNFNIVKRINCCYCSGANFVLLLRAIFCYNSVLPHHMPVHSTRYELLLKFFSYESHFKITCSNGGYRLLGTNGIHQMYPSDLLKLKPRGMNCP